MLTTATRYHAFTFDVTTSVGVFLAHCAIARAGKRCPAFKRSLPMVVAFLLPKDVDWTLYETAAQFVAYKHADTDEAGHRDTIVLATSDGTAGSKRLTIKQIAEMQIAKRVLVLADRQGSLPEKFDLIADQVVKVEPHTPRHVKAAVKVCLGKSISDEQAAEIAQYPLAEINLALRAGRKIDDVLRSLRLSQETSRQAQGGSAPRLEDLSGLGEAGEWGMQLAADIADWRDGKINWRDVDKGCLVSGAPGTGKTTFARALAQTCGVRLVFGSLAKWQAAGHLGDMLKAMRAAFDEARRKAPSILFIDEIDAAGDRLRYRGTNDDYHYQVMTALLECLDGSEGRDGVVVVGACNHAEKLDEALVRPGRLDNHLVISKPDERARSGILRYHLQDAVGSFDISEIARSTEGWTGADLEKLVRDARRSARRARRKLCLDDLRSQLPEEQDVPHPVRYRSAVHEVGHALVGHALQYRVRKVSLAKTYRPDGSRTQRGGGAIFDMDLVSERTREEFSDCICISLAGLAAEELCFGARGAGGGGNPGSDLHVATVTAATIEASYGLGDTLTYFTSESEEDVMALLRVDQDLQRKVDTLLNEQYARAMTILEASQSTINELAGLLMRVDVLSEAELLEKLPRYPGEKASGSCVTSSSLQKGTIHSESAGL